HRSGRSKGRILGEIDEKEPLSLMISSFFNRQCGNWVIVQSFLDIYIPYCHKASFLWFELPIIANQPVGKIAAQPLKTTACRCL
ncbi:MAG: hypothetical protein WC997_15250, partial [Porticoccaceae bacterium]